MAIVVSRNKPGVAVCDECKAPGRPVFSWSLTDYEATGAMIVATMHLCSLCLHKYAEKLDGLPPFLEQMRFELNAAAIYPNPKARYRDIMAMYREAFPERVKNIDPSVPDPNAPTPPSTPEVRKMLRHDLIEVAHEFAPHIKFDGLDRDEFVEAIVEHLEKAWAPAAPKAPAASSRK